MLKLNKFVNFKSFDFLFKKLARPLQIKTAKNGTNKVIEVNEPIVVTNNPSIIFQNGGGGDVPIYQAVWVSRTRGYRKNTSVKDTTTGITYVVTGVTENADADLVYYQLTKDTEENIGSSKGHDSKPDNWY